MVGAIVHHGPVLDRFGDRLDHVASHIPDGSTVAHFDTANHRNADGTDTRGLISCPQHSGYERCKFGGHGGFFKQFEQDGQPLGLARSKT